MNGKPRTMTLAFALASGIAAASSTTMADVTVIPVTGAEVTSEISGTVEIVNVERRMLTIKTPDGRFHVIHAPEQAGRLDEIKIGNKLTITETEAVLVDLVKGPDEAAVGTTQETVVDRERGAKPAGTITDTMTLYGRIAAVDKANRKVSVQGAQETVDFTVNDPALLDELAVGDGVVATFIRSVKGKVEVR
ncbi:copper-binding protein [Thiocapsa sp.]|uniref:copper-binding protein n=1 Tax=Thiocapsa sp. TaxID=2024551 RepID=UPI0025DEFD91|nr:copper-binding protein [Thiocapsa sp.]